MEVSKNVPLISVIVPVYNAAPHLRQCLDSISRQTYENLEIVLVADGGSTDGSAGICEAYAERDARIKVLHRPHEGLVSARKAGVQAAGGEYIAYVDSDDWIEPDTYERLTAFMGNQSPDVVIYGFLEEYSNRAFVCQCRVPAGYHDAAGVREEVLPRLLRAQYTDRLVVSPGASCADVALKEEQYPVQRSFQSEIYPNVWSKLVKRELLARSQMMVPDYVTIGEDLVCMIYTLAMAQSVMAADFAPYHYRVYDTSASRVPIPLEKYRDLFRAACSAFSASPLADTYTRQLCRLLSDQVLLNRYELFLEEALSGVLFGKLEGLRVALYGAGKFGQEIYRKTKAAFPDRIVLWVDRNDEACRRAGLPVEPVAALSGGGYDAVIIALVDEAVCQEIRRDLTAMGIEPGKIRHMTFNAEVLDALEKILTCPSGARG